MSDFDAILAAMGEDVFAHLGTAAVFKPVGGADVACRVIPSAPDVLAGLGDARAVNADARLEVLVSALPRAPKRGDVFVVGATSYACMDKARRKEDDARVWTVDVEAR